MFIVTTDYLAGLFVGVYSTEAAAIEGMYDFVRTEQLVIIDHPFKREYLAEDSLGTYGFYISEAEINKTHRTGPYKFGA